MTHPKNQTGLKALDKLAADPRVKNIWSEDDDLWLELVKGWNAEGCSCIHVAPFANEVAPRNRSRVMVSMLKRDFKNLVAPGETY